MKVSIKSMAMLLLAGTLGLTSCKKDDDGGDGSDMKVTSIKAGSVDLYGATTATDVPSDVDIVITFSSDVNASSTDNIMLMIGSNEADFTVSTSGNMVTLSPANDLATGTSYTLQVNGVKSTGGKSASNVSVEFTTEGVGLDTPPQKSAQTMYLQLNGHVEDLLGNASVAYEQNTWVEDRFGNADGAAYFSGAATAGTGDIIELTGMNFITPSQTVSVWFQINPVDFAGGSKMMFGTGAQNGFFNEVAGDLKWFKYPTVHKVDPDPNAHVDAQAWTDVNGDGSFDGARTVYDWTGDVSSILAPDWAHLVMTFDASTYTKTLYIDGMMVRQDKLDENTTEWYLKDMTYKTAGVDQAKLDKNLALGFCAARGNEATLDVWGYYPLATNTFIGAMDDFRIWNVALTQSQVTELYNSERVQ